MNMKFNHSWLLVACIVIGQMILATEGADLQWANSIGYEDGFWHFKLLDVPSKDQPHWHVTLCQQLPNGHWRDLFKRRSDKVPGYSSPLASKLDVPYAIDFNNGPKIVKAKVVYPSGSGIPDLESEILDLGSYSMKIVVVVCVVGGVCLVVLVAGCVLCKRRRRRRVPFQQPVAAIGQGQVYQTQPQAVGQGQNYRVPQAVPLDSIV